MGIRDVMLGRPSPRGFARRVAAAIKRSGVAEEIQFDDRTFELIVMATPQRSVFLNNIYEEYCRAPRLARQQLLERFARGIGVVSEMPADFEQARPHLLPRVRERFYHDLIRIQMELRSQTALRVPTQPLAGYYAVELAYDLPDSIMTVSAEHLERWGVTFEQALSAARDNLWKISNEDFLKLDEGAFVSSWRDNHDASRLVLHDLIWQLEVKGDHVAMAPHRDVLLVTGADDEKGLLSMAEAAEKVAGDPRAITTVAVRLQGTQWTPFVPEGDSAAHRKLRDLRTRAIAREYEEQKNLLQAQLHSRGEDIFVASVMLMEDRRTGRLETVAAWGQGVDTLLPRVDRIGFIMPAAKDSLHLVDWDVAWKTVGALMKAVGHAPERFRVQEFPNAEQLAAMRSRE